MKKLNIVITQGIAVVCGNAFLYRKCVNWRVTFIKMTEAKVLEMPFWLKLTLTIKEAAAYSNIGINKIEELLKQPKCDFVLYVGNKKLVKRKEFEQYISKSLEI